MLAATLLVSSKHLHVVELRAIGPFSCCARESKVPHLSSPDHLLIRVSIVSEDMIEILYGPYLVDGFVARDSFYSRFLVRIVYGKGAAESQLKVLRYIRGSGHMMPNRIGSLSLKDVETLMLSS